MKHRKQHPPVLKGWILPVSILSIVSLGFAWNGNPHLLKGSASFFPADTGDLNYPLKDSKSAFDNPAGGVQLKDPSNIKKNVAYDPESRQYIITKSIGNRFYRQPAYMSFEEYQKYEAQQSLQNYWKQKTGSGSLVGGKSVIPKLYVPSQVFDRIFGGSSVDIRPQGSAELTFSGRFQHIDNPLLTARAQRFGAFNFDQKIQLNVVGNIGDKLKVTTNYNTEATFDFENQFKLEYTGYEDEIIKKIDLGNVSLPLNSSLISGSQSLFGIKTQLQFGKLTVTSVFTQQKSDQKEINISNGSQTSEFKFSADNYEANKHFFLSQYFRNQYDQALKTLPAIRSGIQVSKVEVWVTNKNNTQTDIRDIIALIDLGENDPYNKTDVAGGGNPYPASDTVPSNDLLQKIPPSSRNSNDNAIDSYFSFGANDNYAKLINARRLSDKEFSFQPQLGYISLNSALNSDEILAVAYRYTVNGVEYTVGEFSNERPQSNPPTVLFVKLLKNVSVKTNLPTWDLMMKNIYSMNAYQVNRDNFKMDVLYLDEKTNANINYLPEGEQLKGKPLITLLNLDRLNSQGLAQPDGVFDFVEGVTISSQTGKIIFPLKEPFGAGIDSAFGPADQTTAKKYSFPELYDSTRYRAQQLPQKNKFTIQGSYQSTSSSEFNLNAINIPQGSVRVTSGTTALQEGVDYTVDYNLGRVKILNEGILRSGSPIKISLESSTLFGIQSKSLFGSRFDYKVSDKLNLGGTLLTLSEKPITQKVNIGDESIRNSMYGLDLNYRTESRFLTALVDKIPLINTKEVSTVTVSGEWAYLDPGHARALNAPGSKSGLTYIDDFEGTKSVIDLRNDKNWFISSTPQLFGEAKSGNLDNGFNRARLSFYTIEPLFYSRTGNTATPSHIKGDKEQLSNHYVRQVIEQEVFPFRETPTGQPNILNTLNLTYYPKERGTYNFNADRLDAQGKLVNPRQSWGGIMRRIESSDFEALNVEFIEFWLMDPFIYNRNSKGGDLYFNLGNISEDILKDGRKSIENGIPKDGDPAKTDPTVWGKVARSQPVTNAFDNDPAARPVQDVGLDGLNDDEERNKFKQDFLDKVAATHGTNSQAYQEAFADPSADNYRFYLGSQLDNQQVGVIDRYKLYNGTQGNSPTTEQSQQQTGLSIPTAASQNPDAEDINRDNTMSTLDEYFEYKVSITPQALQEMSAESFITDKVVSPVKLANGKTDQVTWYQFKIPVKNFESRVGEIQDFRSVRFVRMFLTNFEDTALFRFARVQLVRSEWRKLDEELTPGEHHTPGSESASFDISTINFEENANRQPIPYRLPPSVERERNFADVRGTTKQNEQSLVLNVCDLADGHQVATYKNVSLDFRSYKRIEMFVHSEGTDLKNNDVSTFVRFGTDYTDNYYEYEIPMQVTPAGSTDASTIWPDANKLDIPFELLQSAKQERNILRRPLTQIHPYTKDSRVRVKGSPDLSNVRVIIIGVRNPKQSASNTSDDGLDKCTQVWVNELRLKEFDEDGGWAATGRINTKLADFANVTVSGSRSTFGFGSIDKKVSERNKTDNRQYDIASNVELGKFVPEKTGIKIPMYVSYSDLESRPQYTPGNPDIILSKALNEMSQKDRDSLKEISIDHTTRKSINFTNVKKVKTGKNAGKPRVYDIENWNTTYAYTEERRTSYTIQERLVQNHRGALGYNFSNQPKNIRPFEKAVKSNSLRLIKDFNFNYLPSALDFRIDANRDYAETQLRNINAASLAPPRTFDKNFGITRTYGLKYDLTRALKMDFNATNNSRVEEPFGRIDNDLKRDTVRRNFYSGGKTTDYNQTLNVNYTVPINKIPLLDWTSLSARYTARYDWKAAPPSLQSTGLNFGNTISNSQTIVINPQLNLTTLYNKSKYLKGLSSQKQKPRAERDNPLNKLRDARNPNMKADVKAAADTAKKKEEEKEKNGFDIVKAMARLLTGVRNVGGTYTETNGTLIPGYTLGTQIFGSDIQEGAPGAGFVLGSQKDVREDFARNRWLTRDSSMNNRYITTHKVDLNLRSTVEPLPDLRIELNATRSIAFNTQSVYRFSPAINGFDEFGRTETGNFTMSYVTFATAFEQLDEKTNSSQAFENFENYRARISQSLGNENPFSKGVDSTGVFRKGYGRNAQQVLIPAFLAAYSGKSPDGMNLDAFPAIPLPNWRVSYTGLSKIDLIADFFSNVSINHSYRSTYSVNSFSRPLGYKEFDGDEIQLYKGSANFIPKYEISQITIAEQFAPLIGVDATLKSDITLNVEYKRSRNLGLSFANGRVDQQNSTEFVIGAGYRTRDLKLPFTIGGIAKLENDLNFKFDFSIRNNRGVIHTLDGSSEATSGSLQYSIKPSIDYVVNQRLNVRLFYDRTVTRPYISTSFPITLTNVGVSVRFTLGG